MPWKSNKSSLAAIMQPPSMNPQNNNIERDLD